MRLTAIRALSLAVVVAGLAGCQSGPRWAWWKQTEGSDDKSLLARSAAPALPSTQSTPQVVQSGTLQPAAPPSSANLAASGAPPAASPASLPIASPATVANAPLASYPGAPVTPANPAASPNVATTVPVAAGSGLSQLASSGVPAAGPYDPNGYQASQPNAAASAAALPSADRYAMPSAAPTITEPPTTSNSMDRYATAPASTTAAPPAVDRYASPATAPSVTKSTEGDRYVQSTSDPNLTTPLASSTGTTSPTTAPQSAAAVNLSAQAGQYRPGGTSSYPGNAAYENVEVASRPAPPTTTAQPAPSSVPWTPPTASPQTGTRTY